MTLRQFVDKYQGKEIDWDNAYGGQCVDLFRQYVHEVLNQPQPKSVVGAADFWQNYDSDSNLNQHFTKIKNTPEFIPQDGDVMIWTRRAGNGYGHIAVVIGDNHNTDFFYSFDQNWSRISYSEIVKHNYTNVYGVLRPVKSNQDDMLEEGKIELDKSKFEELVTKATWYDENHTRVDELTNDLEGERSKVREVRNEFNTFMETLSTKLSTIVDKSEIIGAVDRLLSQEHELEKKLKHAEKQYYILEQEKKDEITSLEKRIEQLEQDLADTHKKYGDDIKMLREEIKTLKTGEEKQKTFFDLVRELFERINK